MDTVLGVSMAPMAVRMVLVEGENADGVTIDQDDFDLVESDGWATLDGPDQVIAAILGTREGTTEAGCRLLSTGVTWSNHVEGAALRDALTHRKVENVMLVSAFLAAAALAHAVGNATGYAHTALLFVEADTATLAVVHTADGSIADVRRVLLPEDDDEAVATLVEMASGADALEGQPDGLFLVGSGVDIPMIKPTLEAATALAVSTPEEPDMALARGAALASANAPLFVSSTAALAYALDPGTGAVDPNAAYSAVVAQADGYPAVTGEHFAYAGIADEDDFITGMSPDYGVDPVELPTRQPFLAAISVMTIFVVGVVALVLSMAIAIRPHAGQHPNLSQNIVAPARQVPAPPQAQVPAPPAPAPAPARPPVPARAPAPVRVPAPAPALPPPAAPLPVVPPIIPELPRILAPQIPGVPLAPRGGDEGGEGRGRGGFGGIPGFGGGHGGFGGGRGHR